MTATTIESKTTAGSSCDRRPGDCPDPHADARSDCCPDPRPTRARYTSEPGRDPDAVPPDTRPAARSPAAHADGEARTIHSAALSGGDVPARVLIAPWGRVESTSGSFILDEESARRAVETFNAHGTDLPIDYEHQTLGGAYASPSGKAPAAGWIKRLTAEPGVGLIAEIEWTDDARAMLAAREYRYLSPVAIIRKTDRRLIALHSAALTNKPAIVGMSPIVNANRDAPLAALAASLELPAETPAHEVLVAASQRLADLERRASQRHADHRIREAMRAGKLVEAQRDWAEALVARDEALFDQWLETAPVLVQPGITAPPHAGHGSAHSAQSRAARAEFRANPALASITTEEAYVADALRESAKPEHRAQPR